MDNEQLTQIADGWMRKSAPTFNDLSDSILQTHQSAQNTAIKAVNQMATLRNWLIGCYIVEYEQKGSDRAKYGDRLLKRLEESVNTKGLNETLFLAARRFYSFYPQVADIISPSIHPILSDKSGANYKISATVSQESAISATLSPKFVIPAMTLVSKLSFSHIREIMLQDDPLARFFYETECIKGTWSVRELRRQIATNLYFRSGVSKDPKKLLASIEFEEPDTADASVYLYCRSADFKADSTYIGSLVVDGKEHQSDRSRLGYMAMLGGNSVIGISRSEKVKDFVQERGGFFFRQFILVSDGTIPSRFFLHGKVERRAIGRIGDQLYFIATSHKETLWDFADALREYGFIDAIYITGGADYVFYRDKDGVRHDIGNPTDYPHEKWKGIIPRLVFRNR